MDYKIHVAFGFHVNCYHSYRGDTPDAQGFGSDLRIIRGILAALDALNAAGIPVKGTWDCENFFSLERILPAHAPDILDAMKRRTAENGDEQILMGYSNGALGAMEPAELAASIELAVTNPQGSGLQDLFGACRRIVRPQEVMFSPSQVRTYNKLGVEALCLYYSCVPFDAFQTLIPPLPETEAFNPLTFEYGGEGLTVIPTYSNADVCDAGCLRAWVKDLHAKQAAGEIRSDLFLFINMDADAIFWEPLALPLVGGRLANTGGIRGLATEVADLDYIVFDTPGGYLDTHGPVGKITFAQDTADGNFTGYASWAEKPYNRKIWTAIERSRAAEKARRDEAAFLDRVRLLSTTHFGLATPVLNLQRETAANALAAALTAASVRKEGRLTLHNTTGTTLQCVQLACRRGVAPEITGEGLEAATVLPLGEDSVFALLRFCEVRDTYEITAKPAQWTRTGSVGALQSGDVSLVFSGAKRIAQFSCGGRRIGGPEFLQSYLTYDGKRYDFLPETLTGGRILGGDCLELRGRICLPDANEQGSFCYSFFTSDAAAGIFVVTHVQYPYTPERDAISTENSTLGRYTDMRWQETAPFALSFRNAGPVSVIKRNFEGDLSAFRTASYAEANPRNAALDSFNNQLTAGCVGVTDGESGLLLGNARCVLNAMAVCPMRLHADGRVTMNPFGTFFGRQRSHRNRSGDRIPQTYTLIAPQGKSLAPSYNGSAERAVLCLLPFAGSRPDADALKQLLAFADGAYVTGSDALLAPFEGENVTVRRVEHPLEDAKIRSPLLTGIRGNLGRYLVRGTRAVAYILRRQHGAK